MGATVLAIGCIFVIERPAAFAADFDFDFWGSGGRLLVF